MSDAGTDADGMTDEPICPLSSPTTSSSSAGATPSGPGSRRSSRRTSRSRRSRRTRSATRARSTSSPRASSGRPPTSSRFDRPPEEYRCAPLVELRLVLDWARTIARHCLYETADAVRIEALKASDDPEVAGLAAKIDREEAYHRMHAEMWVDRLLASDEAALRRGASTSSGRTRSACSTTSSGRAAPSVCASAGSSRPRRARRARDAHRRAGATLWEEMTMVRRSVPAGARW